VSRKDDDVEKDWDEEEIYGQGASVREGRKMGEEERDLHMGKMSW
jgi:hypothetical protein